MSGTESLSKIGLYLVKRAKAWRTLRGMRVIEMVASDLCPFAAMMLATWVAEVIRIDGSQPGACKIVPLSEPKFDTMARGAARLS